MITNKTVKFTKTNKTMAFLTIEDLMGTVVVVVFPRDYENYRMFLEEDNKVFVRGRVSEEDESASKLICETILSFEDIPSELWIQFADIPSYQAEEAKLFELLKDSEGKDQVVIYCSKEKAVKKLPANRNVSADSALLEKLGTYFGPSRIKVVEKQIEKV
jgi:DNA polymerase-3 subunit alpha